MNARRFGNKKKRQIVPDLTPLIDVVFLLLIFFMVATTFDDMGGMRIDLPKSSAAIKQKIDVDKISVLFAKEGKLMIKSTLQGTSKTEEVTLETLSTKLITLIERSADKRIGILADRDIDYGNVVDIMSIAREAGAASIDIETKRK